MKFAKFAYLALVAVSVQGDQHNHHLGRHPHVWTFGNQGVDIWTPEGTLVKNIPPERACHQTGTPEEPNLRCFFADAVSDGHKYVWASVSRGHDVIDVFNIDSGSLVGSFATCGSPRDLDFHPMREEIWVHCSDFSAMKESHLDVFSTATPAASTQVRVLMHNNTAARSYGLIATDETLGDVGYSTVYGQNYIYKINLAERMVDKQIDVGDGNPKLNGMYEMAYSPVNQHLYLRTQVCCTCGFVGADNIECGRYGSANITIDGVTTEGQCGRHCVGTAADNIGIFEFDTIADKVVGTHTFDGSAAVDAPFASPDGSMIVIPGLNGGRSVQILTPGANGMLTTEKTTVQLDFDTAVDEDIAAFDSFAWVQTDDMNLFVLSSSIDFKAAIVDMSKSPPAVSYVQLAEMEWPEDARARSRQVEWVKGTDYVWITGRVEMQAYVVDVRNKKLVTTITDLDDIYKVVSVRNNLIPNFAGNAQETGDVQGGDHSHENAAAAASSNEAASSSNDALSIAALAVSCVALVAVVTNFALSFQSSQKKSDDTIAGVRSQVPPSVA